MENYCKTCGSLIIVEEGKTGPRRKEYCSRVCYMKYYNARPDVKARRVGYDKARKSTEEALVKKRERSRVYNSKLEIKERNNKRARDRRLTEDGKNKEAISSKTYRDRNRNCPHFLLKAKLYHINKTYGLSEGDFISLMNNHRGCCAICGDSLDNLNIDHCHTTGEVRGLLCNNCNCAIGLLKDNVDIILSAAYYLMK